MKREHQAIRSCYTISPEVTAMADHTRVFISYARQDGENAARDLSDRLSADPGVSPWRDRIEMQPGDFEDQIRNAIEAARYLLLVLTPGAIQSEWVKLEWRLAQKRGVCVLPVKSAPEPELAQLRTSLPLWISRQHEYDLEKEWQLLVNQLNSPCQATRAPFMPDDLPFGFVKRPAEFEEIVGHVLDAGRKNPSGNTVVLEGAGGFGKTTLALDICDDDEVITAFDGGILWATLGERPSTKVALTNIYQALTGNQPDFTDDVQAAREVFDRIEGKRCLLVIDDVWSLDDLKPFLRRGGSHLTRMITTRDVGIAAESARNPVRVKVAELKLAEAERLLTSRLGREPRNSSRFQELARRLGEWPLLLELANGALRVRQEHEGSLDAALNWINRSLDRDGVTALDPASPKERRHAIGSTVELSLGMLEADRIRCLELGIFPDDVEIPLSIVAEVWHLDDLDTEQLALRISQLSLAKVNLARRALSLHDAMRAYLARQLGAAAMGCHAKLADRWKDPARIPDGYPRRYSVWHIVEAMADPAQVITRTMQLVDLLRTPQFCTWQQTRGDLVFLNRQFEPALRYASACTDPQTPVWIAALPYAQEPYEVNRQPKQVFDLARQGRIAEAVARLELFEADRDWEAASRLLIAWLALPRSPAGARELVEETAGQCANAELQNLLAWAKEGPNGTPAVIAIVSGGPRPEYVSAILQRAGGSEALEGLEPVDVGGFLATKDGPDLVDFANIDRVNNTSQLQRYIEIHASNRYKHYRNRSLWALLDPILTRVPDAAWVRDRIEELVVPALTETPIEFRDFVPFAVRALVGTDLESYRRQLSADASRLTPHFGKNDSWSHYQRRAACLAEVYAALGKAEEAAAMITLARDLPKGFAGFRCYSALTLAEAIGISMPGNEDLRSAAFESARAASHRIQDAELCRDSTAIVNALRGRIWLTDPAAIEDEIKLFVSTPRGSEFCAVWHIGEDFGYRAGGDQSMALPSSYTNASTLEQTASIFDLTIEEIQAVNLESGWDQGTMLQKGDTVRVPMPHIVPLFAARLAGEAFAAGLSPIVIQSLVPLAASSPTTLDTVLGRLLLAARHADLRFPPILTELQPATQPSAAAAREVIFG